MSIVIKHFTDLVDTKIYHMDQFSNLESCLIQAFLGMIMLTTILLKSHHSWECYKKPVESFLERHTSLHVMYHFVSLYDSMIHTCTS